MSYRPDALWDGGSGGYLLWLGRFDPEHKGLDILIEAYLSLAEGERPVLRLHGRDWNGQKTKLTALVRELDLDRWIVIGDPVYGNAKWRLISEAAGCIYPSRWDASPMAVAEAVASGVPTLVADFPLGRLLAKEGAALICDRSPDRIAEGIRRLMSEAGRDVGRRGIELAQGAMSWDSVAASWLDQISAFGVQRKP
jgi:glycosyltransferase involved in cell wall biosynthesis